MVGFTENKKQLVLTCSTSFYPLLQKKKKKKSLNHFDAWNEFPFTETVGFLVIQSC
jgi:hypothetical protein